MWRAIRASRPFLLVSFWAGAFGGEDAPLGAGDELAHPGDAVGEIEEEPLAVAADSLMT